MTESNVLAIIPARGGSKRLPKKNVKLLNGKPLIAYSIEFALKCPLINKVVLSTESVEIANIARDYGAEVLIRPNELAQDTTKTAPVMVHVVDELEKNAYKPDIIVLLQATCPLRTDGLCENALKILRENPQYDSVFSGFQKSYTMATWVKDKEGNATALYDYHLRPRWQDVEVNNKIFAEDGAFYAIKYDAFRKFNDFIGENPYIYEVKQSIDIDTQADFDKVEEQMKG